MYLILPRYVHFITQLKHTKVALLVFVALVRPKPSVVRLWYFDPRNLYLYLPI